MKTVLKGMFTLAVIMVMPVLLPAQDKDKAMDNAKAKSKAAMPADNSSMPMPKPDPQMTKLIKMMSGTWSTTEKSQPSPMMPKGGTGKGTATFTPGPGGLSLVEKYHSSGLMGGAFNGLGLFWWDSKSQLYKGVWCDSMTPGGCDGSGSTKWEGDNLVGTMEGEMNGQKMMSTFTYTDWKPNSFVMKMAMGPDASSLKEAMTITYTRVGAAMKAEKASQ